MKNKNQNQMESKTFFEKKLTKNSILHHSKKTAAKHRTKGGRNLTLNELNYAWRSFSHSRCVSMALSMMVLNAL